MRRLLRLRYGPCVHNKSSLLFEVLQGYTLACPGVTHAGL